MLTLKDINTNDLRTNNEFDYGDEISAENFDAALGFISRKHRIQLEELNRVTSWGYCFDLGCTMPFSLFEDHCTNPELFQESSPN